MNTRGDPDRFTTDRCSHRVDGNALGSNDGLFATAVEGPERGHLKQFLTVPLGAETLDGGPVGS